jgi:hypothetical protein
MRAFPVSSARAKLIALALYTQLTVACASTPDMEVGYFLPKASTQFKAIETVTCDKGNHLLGAVTGTISTTYSADSDQRRTVLLRRLDGPLSDTDVGFDFTDDGRLKGMNAETTGQGEAIVKAAANVFSTLIMAFDGGSQRESPEECDKINKWGGDKKLLTLNYSGETGFGPGGFGPILLKPDQNSIFYAKELTGLGSVCGIVGPAQKRVPSGTPAPGAKSDVVRLNLRQPAVSEVSIVKFESASCGGSQLSKIATAEIQVPQHGTDHAILLQRAAVFGKQGVTLVLSEAGTVTKLKYGKTSGTASAINAFGAAAGAVDKTRAEKLSRLKEEADIIVAQERLVKCLASSKDCK